MTAYSSSYEERLLINQLNGHKEVESPCGNAREPDFKFDAMKRLEANCFTIIHNVQPLKAAEKERRVHAILPKSANDSQICAVEQSLDGSGSRYQRTRVLPTYIQHSPQLALQQRDARHVLLDRSYSLGVTGDGQWNGNREAVRCGAGDKDDTGLGEGARMMGYLPFVVLRDDKEGLR